MKLSGGKHRAAKFDKRFFELAEAGSLYYYKKEGGKALGAIYLRGVVAEHDKEDPAIISFMAEDRQWTLKAESRDEAEAWLYDMSAYCWTDSTKHVCIFRWQPTGKLQRILY